MPGIACLYIIFLEDLSFGEFERYALLFILCRNIVECLPPRCRVFSQFPSAEEPNQMRKEYTGFKKDAIIQVSLTSPQICSQYRCIEARYHLPYDIQHAAQDIETILDS